MWNCFESRTLIYPAMTLIWVVCRGGFFIFKFCALLPPSGNIEKLDPVCSKLLHMNHWLRQPKYWSNLLEFFFLKHLRLPNLSCLGSVLACIRPSSLDQSRSFHSAAQNCGCGLCGSITYGSIFCCLNFFTHNFLWQWREGYGGGKSYLPYVAAPK